jgi:hypothetical protein
VAVLILALLLRAGFGIYRMNTAPDPMSLEFDDERQYWAMAHAFRAGEGLQDELGFLATRMPLYPAALSLLVELPSGVIVARVLHWVLGATAAALTASLANALLGRRVGVAAGLVVAFDPFLVFFSSLLLTETAFILVLVGLMWTLWPLHDPRRDAIPRWLLAGLLASFAVYVRESSLGLVVVLLCFVVLCRRLDLRAVLGAACACALVLATLFPWAARNKQILGESCWLTTRAGISLYDGVGPQATGASDLGNVKQMPAVVGLSEAEWNRFFLTEAVEAIRTDPLRILRLAGIKVARMWNPVPNAQDYKSPLVRVVAGAWSVSLYLLSATGAIILCSSPPRGNRKLALFLLIPAVYLTALHSLFVGSVRYRLGAVPMLAVLAGLALVYLVDYSRARVAEGACDVGD